MRAGREPLGGLLGRKQRAQREAAADAFGDGHQIGRDPGPLVRKQPARAPHARLHLVEHEKNAVPVAQRAQPLEKVVGRHVDAALPLHRLDHHAGGFRADRFCDRFQIRERDPVEAFDRRTKPFQVLGISGSSDGRERAPVESALERDEAPALRPPARVVIAPRRLDGGLAGFGARVAEEYPVGERRRDEPLRQGFLVADAIEIGRVPELLGLLGQRRDEPRMRMAQYVDGDARCEVQVAVARTRDEPSALAALEDQILACVRRHYGWRRPGGVLCGLGFGVRGRQGCGHRRPSLCSVRWL